MDMHTVVDKITSGGIGQHSSSSKGGIQPGFGGLIEFPEHNDVLSGRGGRINNHPGNLYYRTLVNKYKHSYLDKHTKKLDKVKIANEIVVLIRNTNPPGRFLKQDTDTKGWKEIGDEKARKKAGQAMREKATETRREMEEGKVIPQVGNSGVDAPVNVLSSPMPDSPGYANLYPGNMPIVSPPRATPIRVGSNSGAEVVAAYPGGYPQAGPISYDANNFQSPSARMEYAPYNQSVQMLSGLPTQQLNGTTSQASPYRPYSDIGKIGQSTTPKGRQAQTKGKIQENHVHDPSEDNFRIQKFEFKAQTKTQDILGANGVSFNRTFHTLRDSDAKSEISSLDRRSLNSNKTSISSNKTSISSGTTFKGSIRRSLNTSSIDSDLDDSSQHEKYRQSMQFKSAEASDSEAENRKKYQSNVMKNENDLSYLPSQLTDRGAPTPRMETSIKMSESSMLRSPSASTDLIDSDPDDSSQREKYRQMQFKSAEASDSEAENRKKYQNNVMKNENNLSYLPSQLTDRGAPTPSMETSLKMSEFSMLRSPSASNGKECSIDDDDLMHLMGDSVPDLNRPELTLSDAQAVTVAWNSTAATTGRRSSSSSSDLKSNRERLKSENSSDAMSFRLDKGKSEYSSSDAMSFRLDKMKAENISSDDMSLVSRNSIKSNTSVWLNSFKGMQGLPPAGERDRLFSDFSQRSMLSEISSDMLALDLAGGEMPAFFNEPAFPASPTSP